MSQSTAIRRLLPVVVAVAVLFTAVVDAGYAGLLSIEMRNNEDASVEWLEKAIDFCQTTYKTALQQPL